MHRISREWLSVSFSSSLSKLYRLFFIQYRFSQLQVSAGALEFCYSVLSEHLWSKQTLQLEHGTQKLSKTPPELQPDLLPLFNPRSLNVNIDSLFTLSPILQMEIALRLPYQVFYYCLDISIISVFRWNRCTWLECFCYFGCKCIFITVVDTVESQLTKIIKMCPVDTSLKLQLFRWLLHSQYLGELNYLFVFFSVKKETSSRALLIYI